MSRQLDPRKKLTDEERAWAINRNMHELVAQNDETFGRTPHKTSTEKGKAEPAPANRDAFRPTGLLSAEEEVAQRTNGSPVASASESSDPTFSDEYEKWTVDEIKAELDSRLKDAEEDTEATEEEKAELRYGRDERKAELIARLRANDLRAESEEDD